MLINRTNKLEIRGKTLENNEFVKEVAEKLQEVHMDLEYRYGIT